MTPAGSAPAVGPAPMEPDDHADRPGATRVTMHIGNIDRSFAK
jgi:hypothetical protein